MVPSRNASAVFAMVMLLEFFLIYWRNTVHVRDIARLHGARLAVLNGDGSDRVGPGTVVEKASVAPEQPA